MSEINLGKDVKTIAFYLPQYHSIPENDKWWGEGFTEWTNTSKAKPLFKGHYQPRIPINKNYYNLLDEMVMIEQANLAKKYGVWGFCYYHYWFKDGKKLLEKPVERMLRDERVNIPFCLSWANENWTRNWDGGNREVMIEQEYGDKSDWEKHFSYLLDYFRDKRYITFDGKPLFIIYKPQLIKRLNDMLDYWQQRAKECGLKGLTFAYQFPSWYFSRIYDDSRFNYIIKFEPTFSGCMLSTRPEYRVKLVKIRQWIYRVFKLKEPVSKLKKENKELQKYDYDEVWQRILNGHMDKKMLEGAFTDWDNTPRNVKGNVHIGASPEKFGRYISLLIQRISEKKKNRVLFINAWNEWGEGCYLEPDQRYQYAYLENLKRALEENHVMPN